MTQRGRRAGQRHAGGLGEVQGRDPAVALQAQGRQARPEDRAEDHRRAGRSRPCAATSAATSTSTSTGNLYLSTGDDTNPFFSDGYTPIDDSPSRNPVYDARRSAGNTNDLRGKILRIKPEGRTSRLHDPEGQPVRARAGAKTKPEIYAMGLRNPFRFGDRPRRRATSTSATTRRTPTRPTRLRGPAGPRPLDHHQEAGQLWLAVLRRRRRWRTTTTTSRPSVSGREFDCKAPRNDSPYNTGLTTLPAVDAAGRLVLVRAVAALPGARGRGPEGNGGIAPMGGPAYEPIRATSRVFRFPNCYAGKPLFYEWSRDYIKDDRAQRAGPAEGDRRRSRCSSTTRWTWSAGPDGSLYVLEYGDGFFAENPDAQLSKINFVRGNRSPIAKVSASPTGGAAPLTVQFSTAGTTDPDGDTLAVRLGLRRRRQGRHAARRTRRSPTQRNGDVPARR